MTELAADFEKRFPGGAGVRAALRLPSDRFAVAVLFGPSGSGKTTLLRCLAGLERPETGSIRWNDEIWFDNTHRVNWPPQRRRVGYLAQDFALFPHMTVAENLSYGLHELPAAERSARVRELLDLFALTSLAARRPAALSGGEQQRAALARALARRPRLLLLDEPLAALDAPTRELLRRHLRDWLARAATPTVLVTHDPVEAIALGDSVLILANGRVLQTGPVREVFARPAGPEAARIVGVETIEPAIVEHAADGRASIRVGSAKLAAALALRGAVFVAIRAEDVRLADSRAAANRLSGVVRWSIDEGPLVRIGLDCGFPLTAAIPRRDLAGPLPAAGDAVTVAIDERAIHVMPANGSGVA